MTDDSNEFEHRHGQQCCGLVLIHPWTIFEAMAHAAVENLAGRSTFPIIDCEREFTEYVIDDFGVIEVQHEPTDSVHALPVRLTIGPSGFQIEIGEYDFSASQIDVLRRALIAYHRNENAQRTPP